MLTRIAWPEEALHDLDDIQSFIGRESPRYAALVTGRLVAAVDRLREFQESGRTVPELRDPGVREVIHGSYRIVYELREDVAEVLTVFRASRLFPLWDR